MKAKFILGALIVIGLGSASGAVVASAAGPCTPDQLQAGTNNCVPAQEVAIPGMFSAYSLDTAATAAPTFFSAYAIPQPELAWQYDSESDAYTWLQNPVQAANAADVVPSFQYDSESDAYTWLQNSVQAPAPAFQYNPDSDAVTWQLTPAPTSDQMLVPTISAAPALSVDNGSNNQMDPIFLGDNGD